METNTNFDAIIIGGGSGGVGAAYALKNSGYSVAIIEQESQLGGNACNSWVQTWIQGLIPPYIENIFGQLPANKKSGDIEKAWLPAVFFNGENSNQLYMDKDALSAQYHTDLGNGNITIMTNCQFLSIANQEIKKITLPNQKTKQIKTVAAITVLDKKTNTSQNLNAKFFIDASADGVLCRTGGTSINVDYFCGRDWQDMYNESIAPAKNKNNCSCKNYLNEPSLFFQIASNYDDSQILSQCLSVTAEYNSDGTIKTITYPSYLTPDGYYGGTMGVNPMTGAGSGTIGFDILQKEQDSTYNEFLRRTLEYWKFMKLSLQQTYEQGGTKFHAWDVKFRNYGYTNSYASYLGIRESYRINCDYMLRQDDLTKLISSEKLERNIAEGSHSVDFHIENGLNITELNNFNNKEKPLYRPYGIPYDCLIPANYENVLIASRCYGASQIALASARVNMVMAQLGWAAGNAIRFCLNNNILDDVRNIDINTLQSDDYTQFKSRVQKLESKMNALCK